MSDVAFEYDEEKNPGGRRHFAGVPLRALTTAEFAAFAPYVQRSIRDSDMYVAVQKPSKKRKPIKTTESK